MADFSTPFGDDAERRLASANEKQNGFPCGPANQALFNGLFYQLWAELDAIHQEGGIPGDDDVYNTTLLNIQALIDAATGAGDTSQFVLFSQARARLPVYPEFLTTDGKITVTSPATGTIRIPGGISFLHRGIFTVTTTEIDFVSVASKTYHVRWSQSGGYTMEDLADVAYNPSSYAETHEDFDSTFDDMLIARVITNSSNVATITNLVNKNVVRISGEADIRSEDYNFENVNSDTDITSRLLIDIDLARKPLSFIRSILDLDVVSNITEANFGVRTDSRYTISAFYQLTDNPLRRGTVGYGVVL